MSSLPSSWRAAPIRDLTAYVQRGKSPRYAESSDLPVVNQKCVRWSGLDHRFLKFVAREQWDAWGEERSLRQGDILWNSTGTGTIGRAALFSELPAYNRVVADSHVTVVRANLAIEPHYLLNFIKSPSVQSRIEDMQAGSTNQVELAREEVLSTVVPLAPLTEQRRIVAKIDSLSAKSKRARDRLGHIPKLVRKYKQAVLDSCFHNFAHKKSLIDFVEQERGIPYGIIQTGIPTVSGVPTVRCGDIKDYSVNKSTLKLVDPDIESQYLRTKLRGGEILIAVRGSVGNTCVVSDELSGCNISREVAMIPLRKDQLPQFFSYYLTSAEARSYILGNVKGVAQQGINLADLRSVPVPMVDAAVQGETVRRIESAFAWIERLATEATSARALIDRLDQAVLAKAFRGELVPQDPTDESASALLERIRAERAAAPRQRRGRRAGPEPVGA